MIKDENQGGTAMGAALSNAGVKTGGASGNQGGQARSNDNSTGTTQTTSGGKAGFSSLGAGLSLAIPMNNTSEILGKTARALQEVIDGYKAETSPVQVTLIPVDREDGVNRVPISYLIVAAQLRGDKDSGVGYQALIIEGSIDTITPIDEYVPGAPGGKVQVLRTAADADVPAVRELINNIVKTRFNTSKVYPAMSMVVPRDFTDNVSDPLRAKNLAAAATYAASLTLQTALGIKPLNLVDYVGGADQLTSKLDLDGQPVSNLFMQPIRADLKVRLVSEPTDKSTVPGFGATGSTLLASTAAYVDVLYQPKTVAPVLPAGMGMAMFNPQDPNIYKKFAARVVLTDLRSERLQTIGGQMMALASAISLRNNGMYMAAFLPRRDVSEKEIDLRDIGVLNQEVNFGGDPSQPGPVMDIKADSFSNPMLFAYIKAIFHEQVLFAIDVSTRGPDTWRNGALAAADDGDAKAESVVLEAMNFLTNGEMQKRFDPQKHNVTLRRGETIFLGYFKAANGEIRDLREIQDYVALSALFGKNAPQLVRDYSDTIQKTNYPEAQRLAARLDILRQAAPGLVVTGTARRVTFTGAVIDAFVASVEACGASMPLSGTQFIDTGTADRAVSNFSSGFTTTDSSALFTRAFSNNNNANNAPGNQFAGTWRP